VPEAVDSAVNDRLRRLEIRVADRKQDDVFTAGLALMGQVVDLPGFGSFALDAGN
jgi:hypothetical protein